MPDEALLLYTRRYLAQSHLLIPQPNTHCRLPPLAPIIDIRDPFAFSPCKDLDVPPPPPNHSEKLVLEYDTAIYLSSILSAPDDEEKLLCGDFRWSVTHRIEEPLVKEKGKKRTHRVREDTLKDVPLGIGGDTGILWDRNVRRQVQDYVRHEEEEKMSIGLEVLQFLQDVHRPKTPPSTMEVVMEEEKYFRPVSGLMTPPLLASSPIYLPPSLGLSETLDLGPINAGPTSSLIADLVASFMAADSMLVDPSTDCTYSFLQLVSPTPSPTRKRLRPETLMVEAPLTPPASTTKRVRFASLQLPPRVCTPELEEIENESEGKQILAKVEQELGQEQLQEADSTLRIDVPVMDFLRSKLPWEEPGNGLDKVRDLEAWAGLAARKWGGSGCVGIDLSWRPFPRSAIRGPVEELENVEFMDEFMVSSQDGDKVERTTLEGLRTLRLKEIKKEDDADLGPGVFKERMDIEALVKRKKKQKRSKPDGHTKTVTDESHKNKVFGLQRYAGPLSTNPLDTFMALRSRVAKKSANASNSRTIQINPAAQLSLLPTVLASTSFPVLPPFPTPKIHLPTSPGTFIASTTLLSERHLFRGIKDLYPSATIIERDFTVPILDTFNSGPQASEPDSEADLLLSPLSGVVLTTLQKIRQAPLPGNALSSTRQRVADVALLYERLFVLVFGTVRSSDTETIAGFMSFSAALRLKVYVRVIPEEHDVAARWVVALMVREGSPVRLLDEETLWERFLRRAGLNAFAAQVVLRECREIGLRGVLQMEGERRRKLFVEVAGERVGNRVERRLVGVWEE